MNDHNTKTALVHSLNGLLADLFTLYLKTKSFHWHVKGPQFRDLHLLFDEQAGAIFALTDIVAERIRKNQGEALTGIGAIASSSRIADQPRADLAAADMIDELRRDNLTLIGAIRESRPPQAPRATMPPKALPTIGPIRPKPASGSCPAIWHKKTRPCRDGQGRAVFNAK
jgi:starvation-inducible DNA-binding protein